MARWNYFVQLSYFPPVKIVARYRPLDLSYLQSSKNVGMLCVGENRAVWIVLRSQAWLVGVLPVGVWQFNRNKVVRWAKQQMELNYHNSLGPDGWPVGDPNRVYTAIRKETSHA